MLKEGITLKLVNYNMTQQELHRLYKPDHCQRCGCRVTDDEAIETCEGVYCLECWDIEKIRIRDGWL